MVLPVNLELAPCILGKEDLVPHLDVHGTDLSVIEDLPLPDGHDLPHHGLLLGRVGKNDPPLGFLLLLQPFDQDLVPQWLDLHCFSSFSVSVTYCFIADLALLIIECYRM